jgi:hypothetical protein
VLHCAVVLSPNNAAGLNNNQRLKNAWTQVLLRWSKRGPDDFAEAMVSLFPSAVWHQPSVVHDWCLAFAPMWAHHGRLYWKRSGIAISVGSTLVSSGSLIICENETEYDEPGVPFSCVDSDDDSCSVLTDECEPRLHAWIAFCYYLESTCPRPSGQISEARVSMSHVSRQNSQVAHMFVPYQIQVRYFMVR